MTKLFSNSRISIQTKIILPYLILVFLLLAGVGYIGSQIIFDTLHERFVNQLIEAGKLANFGIVRRENAMLEVSRQLAYTRGIPQALLAKDADALRSLALPVAVNVRQDAVLFLDRDGRSVLSMVHDPAGGPADYIYETDNSEMQTRGLVLSVLRGESDEFGDKFSSLESTSFGNYLFIAAPVPDESGELAGVVLVGQSAQSLAETLRQETLAQVTFYETSGGLLATTFSEPSGLDASTAGSILDNASDSSLVRDLTASDIAYSEILSTWRARGRDRGLMGVALPQSFILSFSEQRWLLLLTSTVTALLLVIAIGIFISKNISEPIQRLEQAALQVAKGDLGIRVQSSGRDEIAALTEEFNRMVVDLNQSRQDLVTAYDSTIEAWAKTLELYDVETLGHSQRVTDLTVELARAQEIDPEEMVHVRRGALLHDIGKLTIPISILRKAGPLNDEEWSVMRTHPTAAYEILKNIPFLARALDIPHCHHEHWDGSGYPRGLKGEAIPQTARLFTVVDVWDALRSDRPYRKAMSFEEAAEVIRKGSGTLFDPAAVEALFRVVSRNEYAA